MKWGADADFSSLFQGVAIILFVQFDLVDGRPNEPAVATLLRFVHDERYRSATRTEDP